METSRQRLHLETNHMKMTRMPLGLVRMDIGDQILMPLNNLIQIKLKVSWGPIIERFITKSKKQNYENRVKIKDLTLRHLTQM
jgi:hypothetical protein